MLALFAVLMLPAAPAATGALSTAAERSGFVDTGRYDEVIELCARFAERYPSRVRCSDFGTTPEGRPMKVLVASDDGVLDPATAASRGRPVLLAQGGIHAGEIDGKDAGLWLLRELLDGKAGAGVLKAVTFVFVPVFNVDGHERISPNNRPNQRGPRAMGWRTTSWNLNLNRDYAKADAPEMRAMLSLLSVWDPAIYVDLHVTDGAKFQHDIAVMTEPRLAGDGALQSEAQAVSTYVMDRLKSGGHLPLDFYPSFEKDDDPSSGFAVGVPPPRFSGGYWSQHNRIGVLVETHSWKDYKTRVRATRDALLALLEVLRDRGAALRTVERELDARLLAAGPGQVVLSFDNTEDKRTVDFLGFAYTRVPSAASGGLRTSYDERRPTVWKVPLLPAVKPKVVVDAPAAYLVPVGLAQPIGERLRAHGIRFDVVDKTEVREVESFRATEWKPGAKPYEGRMTMQATGRWQPDRREVARGALSVSTHQPLGKLVVQLFEPDGPDSFVQWGFMNAFFEQKEYMEGYVAEDVAEQLLRDDKVRAEFAQLLDKDPTFAQSAERRLDFFYRKHPSFDDRMALYPVLRAPHSAPGGRRAAQPAQP